MNLDLFTQILNIGSENKQIIERMRNSGIEAASFDRSYKMARAQKMLELRASGMPASMVEKAAEGDDGVSNLRFKAECAAASQAADKELIQNNKKIMDALKSQMEFERVSSDMTEGYYSEYQ